MRPYAICSPCHSLIPSTGSSLRAPARPPVMSLSLIPNVAGGGVVFAGRHSSSSSPFLLSPRPPRGASQVVRARKGLSRSRRLDKRNKNGGVATASEAAAQEKLVGDGSIDYPQGVEGFELSTTPMPVLPGEEKDFWEGPQWNALGFFVQYMWAFGIVFGLIACGIAVTTYNEGATDFRQTPIYKESIQSRELLEEPEASSSDVFEANPTEVAPSLE